MPTPRSRSSRLPILLMGLMIVASFVMLASMFWSIYLRTEEALSQNVALEVRTRLLAERGARQAVEQLRRWTRRESIDAQFSDWTAVEYRDKNGNGVFDADQDEVISFRRDQPLRQMTFPSYAPATTAPYFAGSIRIQDENGDGRPEEIGYSMRYPSPGEGGHDLVSLKILDCASMIYVNGPTAAPESYALAPNVIRMLNQLGDTPEIGIGDLGLILSEWRVRQARDFSTKSEIAQALRWAGVADRKFDAVRDDLTCHAWVDERTLNPGALLSGPAVGDDLCPGGKLRWERAQADPWSGWPGGRGRRWACPSPWLLRGLWAACTLDYLLGEGVGPAAAGDAIPVTPAPGPAGFGTAPILQPRAPVNVNTASVEVLVAVMEGLEACWLDRSARATRALTTAPGRTRRSPEGAVDRSTARAVAEHIVSRRTARPFRTWSEFETFLRGLPEQDVTALRKSVLLAALNPNSRLAAFNPERNFGLRQGDIDKAALGLWSRGAWDPAANRPFCGWTTEFCFSSMGYYQIQCLARLLDEPIGGIHAVRAERTIETVVKIYDVVRLTTQKDFLARTVSTTLLPDGRPAITTFPESANDILRSLGAEREGIRATCLDRPETATRERPACNHALCYDGHVTLTPLDAPATAPILLRARFDGTLDAEAGDRTVAARGTADAHRSLIDPLDPSELFPDGVFCHETRRSGYDWSGRLYGHALESMDEHLDYPAGKTFPAEGCLEMWVKPTWDGAELYDGVKSAPGGAAEALDTRTLFSFGRGVDERPGEKQDQGAPGDRLVVFARRGMLAATLGDPRPGDAPRAPAFVFSQPEHSWCGEFRAVATPIRDWRAGEWHHLRVSWTAGGLFLETDGRRALSPPLRDTGKPFASVVPDGWLFFVGHNRFRDGRCNGTPLSADATIDSLTLSARRPPPSLPAPDRFPAGPRPQGFHMRLEPGIDFPRPRDPYVVGTLTWNGRPPMAGGGAIALATDAQMVDLESIRVPAGPDPSCGAAVIDRSFGPQEPCIVSCALYPANPNSAGFVGETPILEDVTLTVLSTPRYLSWLTR